ncbi:unnamed protein product [Owenia fusiformis]|uniref:Uncharacterized protein n=1 Tax=Owenia fusiformis TaxID=6347 RepID=A0A8S4PUY7_OWEFU|nr:unnamed protein product [Owenia fusiformis]
MRYCKLMLVVCVVAAIIAVNDANAICDKSEVVEKSECPGDQFCGEAGFVCCKVVFLIFVQLTSLCKCGNVAGPPPIFHLRDGLSDDIQGPPVGEFNELLENLKTDGEESCATEVSAYNPNVNNSEQCTALYTVQQIRCKAPMLRCKGCNKNSHSYCVQQYVKNWLPVFCNGGVSWNYHEVPSGCACFKLSKKASKGK